MTIEEKQLVYDVRNFLQCELSNCDDDNRKADTIEDLITRMDQAIVQLNQPTLLQALKGLVKEIQLDRYNIRKDFSLINAHAQACKAIREAEETEAPELTLEDWMEDVRKGDTRLGFEDWLKHNAVVAA